MATINDALQVIADGLNKLCDEFAEILKKAFGDEKPEEEEKENKEKTTDTHNYKYVKIYCGYQKRSSVCTSLRNRGIPYHLGKHKDVVFILEDAFDICQKPFVEDVLDELTGKENISYYYYCINDISEEDLK